MNERFAEIELQSNWRGQIGLNFTQFDQTETRDALPSK